jgi:hypothetical protein
VVELCRGDECDAVVVGGQRGLQLLDGDPVSWALHVGRDDERSVESRSEALREEVVGLSCRQRRRIVARVGEGEAHAEERDG